MDLLSQALRTIFYDVNIKHIVSNWNKGTSQFIKDNFTEQSAFHTSAFTRTELDALLKYSIGVIQSRSKYKSNFPWHATFHLLTFFAEQCIRLDEGRPVVRVGKHLHWRSLSFLIGEDTLVIPYKAFCELKQNHKDNVLSWPNVIETDNADLNRIFESGLCDTHAHLVASAEIFEMTWLDFMNNIVNRDDDYRGLLKMAESVLLTECGEGNYSIDIMLQIAAALRLYIVRSLDGDNQKKELKNVINLFGNAYSRTKILVEIQSTVDTLNQKGSKVFVGNCEMPLDYTRSSTNGGSIYNIHDGERRWQYIFFKRYFKGDSNAVDIANYVYLYLLLKIRVRREFVQTNSLIGFENFKTYQDRKSAYCNRYYELYPYYAVQSSIRPDKPDAFETRVSPIDVPSKDLSRSVFEKNSVYTNINRDSLTFVIHMLKRRGDAKNPTYKGSRNGYNEMYHFQIDAIIEDIKKRKSAHPENPLYDIVGIDAAGSELICSAAVFGHTYRYARAMGVPNLTYHVGEDFFDLTDGLLAVEEALTYLELRKGSRIGHASVLGVNAKAYYTKRSYQVLMTKQRLLDCLVWILAFSYYNNIKVSIALFRELWKEAHKLYIQIGYKTSFKLSTYYWAIYLRSDELSEGGIAPWSTTSYCMDSKAVSARTKRNAKSLNLEYQTTLGIIENGKNHELYTFPREIVQIVSEIQNHLLNKIKERDIVIESNPTSNLCIGPFEDYSNLPLFKFEESGVRYSVNTDDKGVFATSLSNELSLVAESYDGSANDIVRKICVENKKSRFKMNFININ